MQFDWWTLALQIVNFAILVWVLHHFLYRPVLRMIDTRRAVVQKQRDDAKAIEDKARACLAEMEKERAGIAAEREAALQAAAAQAQQSADARHAQAEREAQDLTEAAHKALAVERARALADLRIRALDLGAEFARRFLAEVPVPLRAEAWIERIEAHLKSLPKAELEALARQSANGDALTVVTASPLPPETTEAWRGRLRASIGDSIPIAFDVNADLVAGAELHFPTAILRFSLQSVLETMRAEIGPHANAHG